MSSDRFALEWQDGGDTRARWGTACSLGNQWGVGELVPCSLSDFYLTG